MTLHDEIVNYCYGKSWLFGGIIEDFIRDETKHKASNVARRCRELANMNLLERRETKVNGRKVVEYRHVCNDHCGQFFNPVSRNEYHKCVNKQSGASKRSSTPFSHSTFVLETQIETVTSAASPAELKSPGKNSKTDTTGHEATKEPDSLKQTALFNVTSVTSQRKEITQYMRDA